MTSPYAGSRWIEVVLRPVLIAAMAVCLAAPFVTILEWLWADWQGTALLIFVFLVALEGILSERVLRARRPAQWEYLASRAAELVVILLLLKMANYIPLGLDLLKADAQRWLADPYQFLTSTDLLTGLLVVPLWLGALFVSRTASGLDLEESRSPPPADKASAEYYLWLTRPPRVHFYDESLDYLAELFVWGGIALILASAAVYALVPAPDAFSRATVPTLVYFALGLALLTQARFAVAQAGWRAQQVPIQPGIARRWLLWALLFFLIVSFVALLLPTSYALGPISTVYGLVAIFLQILMLIVSAFGYLLALLLSLLIPTMQAPAQPPLTLQPLLMSEAAAGVGSSWLEVLLSAVFWVLIAAMAGYALWRFLRDRFGFLAASAGQESSWLGRLAAWLRSLWQRLRGWPTEVQGRRARRRAELAAAGDKLGAGDRWLSVRRLAPRQLIWYFYLSVVRRAAQAGQPRRPGQTPYEYQAALDARYPDLEPDLAGLTDSFVHARYSCREVLAEDAQAVKPLWQRVKTALRRKRT